LIVSKQKQIEKSDISSIDEIFVRGNHLPLVTLLKNEQNILVFKKTGVLL